MVDSRVQTSIRSYLGFQDHASDTQFTLNSPLPPSPPYLIIKYTFISIRFFSKLHVENLGPLFSESVQIQVWWWHFPYSILLADEM
jgi:hypothetical protein